jgi:hypothetical protein
MKSRRWMGLLNTLVMLMLVPTLGACSNEKKVEWTEDVKLSDGRMIVVNRYEEYRRVTDAGAGFRVGWLFQKSRITAELPAPIQRKVSWEGNLIPLVLDVRPDKSVYFVGWVATGAGMIEWKVSRREHYVVFRLTNEGWQRIPLVELPLSVQPNLLGSTERLFISGKGRSGMRVDLKLKEELASDPAIDAEIKSIISTIRRPMPAPK